MKPVKSFIVRASLPKPLETLRELAYNILWHWDVEAIKLFYRLDRELWEEKYHNPVSILGSISQSRLEFLSKDEGVIAHLNRVKEQYDNYMSGSTWYSKK